MKTQYLLPVCFAAAAHGALLFGVSKSTPRPLPPVERVIHVPFVRSPEPEEPVPPPEDPVDARARTEPVAPSLPRSAEPPPSPVLDSVLTIVPPPLVPIDPGAVARTVAEAVLAGVNEGGRPGGTATVIGSEFLDNTPRTRFQSAPVYPHEARRDGRSGQVVVTFIVDEDGLVREPRVVESTDRVFEEATLRAVSRWRFEPGRRDGRIVRFRMAAPVVFSLNE